MPNPFMMPVKGNNEVKNTTEITLASAMQAFQEMLALGNNPQQIQQALFAQHPKFKEAADTIQKSGLNPIDYAMKVASQKKINVTPAIQNMMNILNQNKGY